MSEINCRKCKHYKSEDYGSNYCKLAYEDKHSREYGYSKSYDYISEAILDCDKENRYEPNTETRMKEYMLDKFNNLPKFNWKMGLAFIAGLAVAKLPLALIIMISLIGAFIWLLSTDL